MMPRPFLIYGRQVKFVYPVEFSRLLARRPRLDGYALNEKRLRERSLLLIGLHN
jgi:hypothetical protein